MSLTLMKRRLQGARTEKGVYNGLDMASTEAFGSVWMGCVFTDCDFALSNFQTAEFFDCDFVRCEFKGSNFRAAKLRHVRFEECDLRHCAFVGVTPAESVSFRDCKLQYASFFDSTVRSLLFLNSNLHGTDLRYIEAHDCRYEGSNLWSAVNALGCQFWNGTFDERSCDFFVAMVGRVHPNPEKAKMLAAAAGEISVKVTDRLMGDRSA